MSDGDSVVSTCWILVDGIPREVEYDPGRRTSRACYDDERDAWDAAASEASDAAHRAERALADAMRSASAADVHLARVLHDAYQARQRREAADE